MMHQYRRLPFCLYLELLDEVYDIGNTEITGDFAVFDELVAYSARLRYGSRGKRSGRDLHPHGERRSLIMDGSGCNTYQNRTALRQKHHYVQLQFPLLL
jgi:hypothetical protein